MIEDLRNNSAWNYRHFILKVLSKDFSDEGMVAEEAEFVKKAIRKLPLNESAWTYLSG